MIRTEAFRTQLQYEFRYRTPELVERRPIDRLLGGFDFWYACGVLGVIWKGGRLVRAGRWNVDTWLDLSLDMWRTVEACKGRIEASGCEHLAALEGQPAVIVANHMSLLETFAIPALVLPFGHMTFVVKESLVRLPLFRDVMVGVEPISIIRKNPRDDLKKLMVEGPRVLNSGRSVVVFPQATRGTEFKPSLFNTLGVKMAKRAGVPVVPLALKTDFHGLGRIVRDCGRVDRRQVVHFAFGSPVAVGDANPRDVHARCVRFIGKTLKSWGGSVEGDDG